MTTTGAMTDITLLGDEAVLGAGEPRRAEAAASAARALRRYLNGPLSTARVAAAMACAGMLMLMLVSASAPNVNTLLIRLPSSVLPSQPAWLTYPVMILGLLLACGGLAGMLAARGRGWSPNPRVLFGVSTLFILGFVNLTPVGSGDTASYAAYGRLAALGYDPYTTTPNEALQHTPYFSLISKSWQHTPSVYGPIATWIQEGAARIGGDRPWLTIWMMLIFNGLVFLGVGLWLLLRSADPVRATLLWTANPVLIAVLVTGGHVDTLVAAGTIVALRLTRPGSRLRGELAAGVVLGVAVATKVDAGLVAATIAGCLLVQRRYRTLAVLTVSALITAVALYIPFGLSALAPLSSASKLVALPSVWDLPWVAGQAVFGLGATLTAIGVLWPLLMIAVAVLLFRRVAGAAEPATAVTLTTLAWIIAAPWAMPWYCATGWAALSDQEPPARLAPVGLWLGAITMVLALVHSSGGHPW
jgi:hypothetical protein